MYVANKYIDIIKHFIFCKGSSSESYFLYFVQIHFQTF